MVRIRFTVWLINGGREVDATEIVFILKVMKDFSIVVLREEKYVLEKSNYDAEGETDSEDAEGDVSVLCSRKFSYIEFGRFIIKSDDLGLMKKFGYIVKDDDDLVRFVGDEVVSEPKDDEVMVFKSFFRAGFRFLIY